MASSSSSQVVIATSSSLTIGTTCAPVFSSQAAMASLSSLRFRSLNGDERGSGGSQVHWSISPYTLVVLALLQVTTNPSDRELQTNLNRKGHWLFLGKEILWGHPQKRETLFFSFLSSSSTVCHSRRCTTAHYMRLLGLVGS